MQKAIVLLGWELDKEFPKTFGEFQVLNCVSCKEAGFPEYEIQLYVFSVVAPYAFGNERGEKSVFDFLKELRESNEMTELWCCTYHPVTLSDWSWEPAINAIVHPEKLASELENWAAST